MEVTRGISLAEADAEGRSITVWLPGAGVRGSGEGGGRGEGRGGGRGGGQLALEDLKSF